MDKRKYEDKARKCASDKGGRDTQTDRPNQSKPSAKEKAG